LREGFSAFWQAASTLIGLAVFLAIMWLAARYHSRMWRMVAAQYAGKAGNFVARKLPETIVIAGRVDAALAFRPRDYRQYAGAILTLREDALAVSLIPPFNIFCPPILLPFGEMTLAPTAWALWPDEPYAIRMKRLPEIDIIVGRDTVQWIRSRTDAAPFGLGV
jgi:hypothetical protein